MKRMQGCMWIGEYKYELKELADSLDDVDRFLAVASPEVNSYKRIIENDFIDFFCQIDLFDSSSWEIIIND